MLIVRTRAQALPIFAQQYGVPCQKCHTAIPALNTFGAVFQNNGFHIPGTGAPPPVFPLAVKVNAGYTSAPDPDGLPKAIVDEIELLTAGTVGSRGNYFAEQYLVDGGTHGNLREAWFNERLTSEGAHVAIDVRAGQFTLPLPVDPESFRETAQHYAVFDQTIGGNPFNFFDPKPGLMLRAGDDEHGLTLDFAALQGHDVQSGLPSRGVDLMQSVHERLGWFDLTAYRYAGRRPIDSAFAGGGVLDDDRFTRTGLGLRFARGRWTSESVLQENTDTNSDGFGHALHSSGGFTQLRYAITRKLFGLVRYDGTNDDTSGMTRSTTALLGYRLTHNSRVTLEDVITHAPAAVHTLNAQFTVAY